MLPSDFNVASVFLSVGLSTMMGLFLAFRAGRRLRGLTQDNYEEKVYDFVFDSLRDLISTRLGDLLESQGVSLPPDFTICEVAAHVHSDAENAPFLEDIYNSLMEHAINSPHYINAVTYILQLGGGGG